MIIIRLKGGMGNQIFQYALGLKLASLLNTELRIDLSSLLDRSKGDFVYRDYDLSIFQIPDNFLNAPGFLKTIYRPKLSLVTKLFRQYLDRGRTHIKEKHFHFQPEILAAPQANAIYEGWFQSYRYFAGMEEVLRKQLVFKNPILPKSKELLQRIKSTNAICLNVRRTDFLKVDALNTTSLDYFLTSAKHMATLVDQPSFFIFSDDIDWCKENILLDHPVEIVDHQHKGEKFGNYMQLMIACQHYIIPNSSFAWWAVWLNQNPDRKVIAPKNWFNDKNIDTSDLVPPDWIRF